MGKKNEVISHLKKGIPILKHKSIQFSLKKYEFYNDTLTFADEKNSQQVAEMLRQDKQFAKISAGELYGLNLIVQVYRKILEQYLEKMGLEQKQKIELEVKDKLSAQELTKINNKLASDFQVKKNEELTEAVIIWLSNENPAFSSYAELFKDHNLRSETKYLEFISLLDEAVNNQPKAYESHSLFQLLKLPAEKHPNSIYDQLSFIRTNFNNFLGDVIWEILQVIDVIQEERAFRGGGPGPSLPHQFNWETEDYERFSSDRSWMSSLVLMAKSTYVWLAQLSRKYQRQIVRLDEIPEEELRVMAERGIDGLWLIGIWERSYASKNFKQLKGNSEAMASAYSLKNYHVAAELGGDEARKTLQQKAWKYGIRLGCDMVPNHMGIDSDWVVDHPDWFLQAEESPYPAYQFNSQNMTNRVEIEVFIEDHYYDETDAAVVYKLYDKRDGRVRFIYHGNDGTSTPWNDTAQLNFLSNEVREAVVNEIVNIAQSYPIIRFDAAMTLAKRHVKRLWFPPRGSGGDIPSRSRYALSDEEFEQLFPTEFWRTVVDRVAAEAPDTLLLAEAFWMMEGYFVRTLGMHRVYNSAFMNMLKAEENDKYRESIKNVLSYNPQILKRFVNFMSNPDEDTAIEQYGRDDKYFGVCVLMATMPGLPMLAHGQLEGYSERYGMEFARPRTWELEDKALMERHEREIFPLLRARELFAEVDNFLLYDFHTELGSINENVFAYSNQFKGRNALVLFHNSFDETRGWVNKAYNPDSAEGTDNWQEKSLASVWNLHNQENWFTIYTDAITGLTYLSPSSELCQQGIYLELQAFKYKVYWDVWEVEDENGKFKLLHKLLGGKGTANLNRELKRLELGEMLEVVQMLVSPISLKQLLLYWEHRAADFEKKLRPELKDRLKKQVDLLLIAMKKSSETNFTDLIYQNLKYSFKINFDQLSSYEALALLLADIIKPLSLLWKDDYGSDWFHNTLISLEIETTLSELDRILPGIDFLSQSRELVSLTGMLIELLESLEHFESSDSWLKKLFAKPETTKFLKINTAYEVSWFDKDSYQIFLKFFKLLIHFSRKNKKKLETKISFFRDLENFEIDSEYKTQKLFNLIAKGIKA